MLLDSVLGKLNGGMRGGSGKAVGSWGIKCGHLMSLNSCCNKRKVYQRVVDGRSSVLQAAA